MIETYKPFSTIGYNTENFLKERLEEIKAQCPDCFWCYIYHRDEKDKKDHYHLYIDPQKRMQKDDLPMLRHSFEEVDPGNDKPLGCMPFQKSKFKDWYLYAIHDSAYLSAKHLNKSTYDYSPDLVQTSDREYLNTLIAEFDQLEYLSAFEKMQSCKEAGMTLFQALAYLRIPYSGMYGFMKIWQQMDEADQKKERERQQEQLAQIGNNSQSSPNLVPLDPDDDLPF